MTLEPTIKYLHHLNECNKWAQGWYDHNRNCTCGLDTALTEVDKYLLNDFLRETLSDPAAPC
jgi:hypothetical protein